MTESESSFVPDNMQSPAEEFIGLKPETEGDEVPTEGVVDILELRRELQDEADAAELAEARAALEAIGMPPERPKVERVGGTAADITMVNRNPYEHTQQTRPHNTGHA